MDQPVSLPGAKGAARMPGQGAVADDHPGLPLPRRGWAIGAIGFGTALLVLDGSIANVALPTIARDLEVSHAIVTGVVTVYQLVLVMFLLPFASAGDRIGHRTLYQAGQALFMAASTLCLLVDSFAQLLILRALQALGAAMALSVTSAMLRQIYPASMLGTGLGINSVIVASSSALAPALGGYIAGEADWRFVFVAAAPLAVVSLLLGRALPTPQPAPGQTDWCGSGWSALTMLLIVAGLQVATHGAAFAGVAIGALGLASLVLLLRRERARVAPVVPVDLLAVPAIGLSALAAMASFIAAAVLLVSLPFRLEEQMGLDPQTVGLVLLPFALTMLVVSPLAGWLSDRVAPTWLGVAGMAIAVIGLVLLITMPARPDEIAIGARLAVVALGFGLFFAPNTRLMIGRAPRERAAAAGGVQSTARLMGQMLGAVLAGLLLAGGLGMGPAPLVIACALCVLAAGCSLVRYRYREAA